MGIMGIKGMNNPISLSPELAYWLSGVAAGQKMAAEICRESAAAAERCGNPLGAARANECADKIESDDFIARFWREYLKAAAS